jgi:putative sigma-54 modulation protein
MQKNNVNFPIIVTGRHVDVTEAMREYAEKKVRGLHIDYPKIIEAKILLDVAKNRQTAEIILYCAQNITIEASAEAEKIYAAIDEATSRIARRMRKHKTRMLKTSHRPRGKDIKHLPEKVFTDASLETEEADIQPALVHEENYRVSYLYPDEAIMELEASDRAFVLFRNVTTGHGSVLYRRGEGEYGLIELDS